MWIHTQKSPQPRIVDSHAIIQLISRTLHFIVIFLAVKPVTVGSCCVRTLWHLHPECIIMARLFKELLRL